MLTLEATLRRGPFALDVAIASRTTALGLFGPSGAGKTTLLHVVAGVVRVAAGRVQVGARTLVDSTGGTFLPPHRRGIGVVFQEDRLFPHRTVRRNLTYGRWRTGGPTVDEVVDSLELGALLEKRPRDLSGGERRRVAIGRAVLASSTLLLLDEPLTGLDARLAQRAVALVHRRREATSIPLVAVSHDLDALLDLVGPTGDIAVLDGGRVVAIGAASKLDAVRRTPSAEAPRPSLMTQVCQALTP